MIRTAEWDSKFFKYPVGILNLEKESDFHFEKFLTDAERFRLVYVISEVEITSIPDLKLMDEKLTYSKKIEQTKSSEEIIDYDPTVHSYSQLLKLAYASGIFSRFNRDENFKRNEFKTLYRQWLDKSISKKRAFQVLVKPKADTIAGFVTLGMKEKKTAEIGLIAVDTKFQRMSIGTQLIRECEFLAYKKGLDTLIVATQYENSSARKLYEKNDFGIRNRLFIYHYWNL